jgi:hypothetical protein
MSRASQAIWDFVSGVPKGKRERRSILMLQAYIDDSKTHGDFKLFILAGYLATAKQWASFSDEWHRFLDMGPRIEYFKLREALRRSGEFDGRDKKLCTERIVLMRGIIEKHDLREFSISFYVKDYAKHYEPYMGIRTLSNPYYFASTHIAVRLARSLRALGFESQPVEVIFDEQVREKSTVLESWDFARRLQAEHPEYSGVFTPDLIFQLPTFGDDKQVLPLQAADMHATYRRLVLEELHYGRPWPKLPGKSKELKGFKEHLEKSDFKRLVRQMLSTANELKRRGIM